MVVAVITDAMEPRKSAGGFRPGQPCAAGRQPL